MNRKGLLWELHCFPLFAPNILPQSPSPSPPRPPQPRQAAESSPPPQRWTSHPDGSTFRTLEPPTANSPLHRSRFSDWLVHRSRSPWPPSWSTAPDLLNRRPRPPQRRPFTDSLVRPFAGPSYKPSSAATDPPHRKHCTTRPPKPSSAAPDPLHGRHIQLHRPCFTDAAASSGYFDLYSFDFSLYRATVHLPQMSFLVCRQAPQP